MPDTLRFGSWLVSKLPGRKWDGLCVCGARKLVDKYSLLRGVSLSCGCLRGAQIAARLTTHGLSKCPEYRVWHAMLERCTQPQAKDYKDYGARGIKVCRRWFKFENFIADMGRRPTGQRYTLERSNNSKGYSAANCYWATYTEQARNKRSTLRIDGVPLTTAAELAGVAASAVRDRLYRGCAPNELLLPSGELRRVKAKRLGLTVTVKVHSKWLTLKEVSEQFGVPYTTLRYRHRQGLRLVG